ncbi:MAG TPA: hypothetical protein ENJ79_02170 [Gammaproteobacteria bacterium]|nr:hypothetical protein [Gammaproteobacteria bacterium]
MSWKQILLVSLAILLGWGGTAQAGGSAVFEARDESMHGGAERMDVHWSGGDRLRVSHEGGYTLYRDGHVYMVHASNGKPEVYDLQAMMQQMQGMQPGGGAVQGGFGETLVKARKTGRTEVVAGLRGEVHEVTVRWEKGEETRELVLSRDPAVVELTRAWIGMLTRISPDTDGSEESLESYLVRHKAGLLRFGDDMRLVSLDRTEPDPALFELPAPPRQMPDLRQRMPAGAAPSYP